MILGMGTNGWRTTIWKSSPLSKIESQLWNSKQMIDQIEQIIIIIELASLLVMPAGYELHQIKQQFIKRQISNFIYFFRLGMNTRALLLSLICLAALPVSPQTASADQSNQPLTQPVPTTQVQPIAATSVEPSSISQAPSEDIMPTAVSVQPTVYLPVDTTNQIASSEGNEETIKLEQQTDAGSNQNASGQNTTQEMGNEVIENNQTMDSENRTLVNQNQNDSSSVPVTQVDEEVGTPKNQSELPEVNTTEGEESLLVNGSQQIVQEQNNGQVEANSTEEPDATIQDKSTINDSQLTNESEETDTNQSDQSNQTQIAQQPDTVVDASEESQDSTTGDDNIATAEVATLPTTPVSGPEPTTFLPNPTKGLTPQGQQCLQKCRQSGGVSCKKWEGKQITCCKFTGCQWPFYCNPSSRIEVEGCENMP